ncbi:MAG: sugar isomerase domain-containing protein [Spirochaetia bacterium]
MNSDFKSKLFSYYETVLKNEQAIIEYEMPQIKTAAKKVVQAIKSGNKVWGYGPGHANEFIQAMLCTPAGIPFISCLNAHVREVLFDNVYGLGELFAQQVEFQKGDIFFFVSISGRHPLPIEIIKYAQSKGVYTIGLTSVKYSGSSAPNNKWNSRLYEAADLVFDNHVDIGDTCVVIQGIEETISAVSGVMSMFFAELLMAEVAAEMERENVNFPVFRQPNLPGSDKHNTQTAQQARNWVNYFNL